MHQGAPLAAIKHTYGFVMGLVNVTFLVLFNRLHNDIREVWHASLLKDQENSMWPCLPC